MSKRCVQDIMACVQKPSRYLGTEVNSVKKNLDAVKLKLALAFPDLYEIGSSHFGIQILYHLLNRHEDIAVERVFAPAQDLEAELRQNHIALFSLESQRSLAQFDIIGFSLLYELNYTNVLNMLDLAQIPLRWEQRGMDHPFIIAGGPCVCNPEPMADFFDAMVFGDGEYVVMQMVELWLAWKAAGGKDKFSLLKQWSLLEGVYIPMLFKARYDRQGFQHLDSEESTEGSITRTIVADLDQAYFPGSPIIAFGKPVHDRLRIEISRGCSRGCRFCQAGMIYRPVRERSSETILELVRKALDHTGYDDLSLLSLSTGDYTCLAPLMENLMQLCQGDRVAVSLPSLRAGSLTPRLMELIRSIRKTGFTIAPEAGSQRLRDVINKNITYDDVAVTVKNAFELGWKVIKLYFMVGLPTETDEDLDAIVDMVCRLKMIKGSKHRKGQINVSITTLVPKPHTPLQWSPQLALEESRRRIEYLKGRLRMPGVRVKWQHPEMSALEGALSRGDRRISHVIEQAWKDGCTFDGWNDSFDFKRWRQAFAACNVDSDFFTIRARSLDEPLPWAHMDTRVDVGFLRRQWNSAHQGEAVADCRHGDCHACGVCDFKGIQPKVFEQCTVYSRQPGDQQSDGTEEFIWLVLSYSKLGRARFFGHLELVNIFARAVRRAKIGVQYSRGFHPSPRMSFDDPLPLGMASEAELMRIMVSSKTDCSKVVEGINAYLPVGVRITDCRPKSEDLKISNPMSGLDKFRIELVPDTGTDSALIGKFMESSQWLYRRARKKGPEKAIDLKTVVKKVEYKKHNLLYMEIERRAPITVRPADFLMGVLQLTPEQVRRVLVTKVMHKN